MSYILSLVIFGLAVIPGSNTAPEQGNTAIFDPVSSTVNLDETENFDKTYPFSANGRVQVSNVNGSITVEAWDRNEIRLQYTKTASTKELFDRMNVVIEAQSDLFSVHTKYKSNYRKSSNKNGGKSEVVYKLTVPRNARLESIETVNGSVAISNMASISVVHTVNGEIKANNIRGTTKLSTVNGMVLADFDSLDSNSQISLNTVNGKVKLTIPSNSNCTIKASTTNGSISNGFSLPVRKGKYVGKDMYGKIGGGDVKIKLYSVNGGLSVERKQDGKTANPAVNLLKTDSDIENDFEFDADFGGYEFEFKKMKVDFEKAQKEMTKAMEKANLDAEKIRAAELAKVEAIRINEKAMEEVKRSVEKMRLEGFKIDEKMIEQSLKEAEEAQRAALENQREALYFRRSPYITEKTGSFEVKGVPKVNIDAPNCDVIVKGWDKDSVKYTVTRISSANNPAALSVNADSDKKDKVSIRVDGDGGARFRYRARIKRVKVEVYVPKKADLDIETNMEIRVEGVTGKLNLTGNEGAINIRDSAGALTAATSEGMIRVIGFEGDVDTRTCRGNIGFEGNPNKITVATDEGTLILSIPEEKKASLKDSESELDFIEKDGKLFLQGGSDLSVTF